MLKPTGMLPRRRVSNRSTWVRLLTIIVSATAVLVVMSGRSTGSATSTSNWWKVDLHDHSVISADAFPDLGIMAQSATTNHFNAIFLTDHNLGSNFAISGLTANHMTLDETLDSTTGYFRRWTAAKDGSLSATTNAVSTADHYGATGSRSLLLSSTSSATGETFAWTKRGPNLRSETGPIDIKFAVKPTRLDSNSSLYVSASIGGDPTVGKAVGYTTADNVVHPGKSTILVWYLGAAPPASLFPGAGTTVYEFPLAAATLNSWNPYSIDVRAALAGLHTADVPLDYDALSDLKISSFANGGTATAYFDQYALDAPDASANNNLAADEFVYRNSLISRYANSAFQFFPGVEEGENEHAQRFNFDITSATQFVNHSNGIDGIPETQATGYPAQLNHPGVSGGVTDSQATSTNAESADLMEVRQQNMITDWDTILRQDHPQTLIGTWGGDNHVGSWSNASQATYIYAPSLDLDSLMHALFEGRAYVGTSAFASRMSFSLGSSASTPYPARYPVYVAAGTSQDVHLAISTSSGLTSGYAVIWKSNGGSTSTTSTLATDTTTGSSYDMTRSIPVSGAMTYVRAEVRKSAPSGSIVGLTEPIAFRAVPGLPSDVSIHVDSVTPASNCECSLVQTQGIKTTPTWNATSKALNLALTNPANSTVELLGTSSTPPSSVTMDGKSVPVATSLSAFQTATGDAWYYAAGTLYLQDAQSTANSSVTVNFGANDSTPPTVPTALKATGVSSSEIDLQWTASTDGAGGSGLAGYNVYRGTQKLNGSTPVTGTTFSDTGLNASTSYTYTVTAVDNAGNESPASTPATGATLAGSGGTFPFTAVADAYVDSSSPSFSFGARTTLRVDTSPTVRSYLRFAVAGISGTVTSVQLKLHANSSGSKGFDVYALTDDTWKESTLTYTSAPAPGAQIGTSGAVTSSTDVTVSLPASYVSGNGDVNVVLVGLSSTAISLASRESATPPQLIVTTSASGGAGGGDTTRPNTPTGLAANPLSATEVDLSWNTAQDNTGGSGIKGYNVYRDGTKLTSTPVSSTGYADKTATAGNTYQYAVSSIDNAGNESTLSATVPATTPTGSGGGAGTFTFKPTADAYVDSSNAGMTYGSSTKLRVDGSPTVNSFLRFSLSGVTGTVTSVTLKVFATSSLTAGFAVYGVSDDTWPESITYTTEPTIGSTLIANSSPATANSYVTVNLPVTAVPSSGDVSFALTARSPTALALLSRESSNPPQLVVTTS